MINNPLYLDLDNTDDLVLELGDTKVMVVSVKYNTTANWNAQRLYIPAQGELDIYSDHEVIEDHGVITYVPGIKIGDGNAYLIDMPFVGEADATRILVLLNNHIGNTGVHVTPEQKTFWNNKINCEADELNETLVFNRN